MPPKKFNRNEVLFDPKSQEQQLASLKEIELQPSTIETIDRAIFEFIDEDLDVFCSTNKGFKKVPFICQWLVNLPNHEY